MILSMICRNWQWTRAADWVGTNTQPFPPSTAHSRL